MFSPILKFGKLVGYEIGLCTSRVCFSFCPNLSKLGSQGFKRLLGKNHNSVLLEKCFTLWTLCCLVFFLYLLCRRVYGFVWHFFLYNATTTIFHVQTPWVATYFVLVLLTSFTCFTYNILWWISTRSLVCMI